MGKMFARHFRALGEALRPVYEISREPGIAIRQMHSDVGRFLSRVYVHFRPRMRHRTQRQLNLEAAADASLQVRAAPGH